MHLRRKTRMHSEVNTHSMNDIMFFLMLFFLLVSTMVVSNGIKINLPKSQSGKNMGKQNIVLSVDSALNCYIDKNPVKFEDLEKELGSIRAQDTSSTIILKADGNLTLQEVIDIMGIGAKLNMKFVLATNKK